MYSRTKSNALKGALLVLTALSVHCADVGEFCFTAGPSCGLTVDFDGGELDVGTYAITIETPAGVTSCDYVVATADQPSHVWIHTSAMAQHLRAHRTKVLATGESVDNLLACLFVRHPNIPL